MASPVHAEQADRKPAASEAVEAGAPPEEESEQKESSSQAGLAQSVQGESGITIQTMCTNCNNADLSLAGMGGDYVQLSCDGLPVASGLSQVYLLAIMPQTVIDKVDVTKGAGDAALVGGAVGGEIEIETRTPESAITLNASADVGSYGWSGTRVDLGGRAGWFGGTFVGSMGTSDVIDANDDGNPDLPAFDRYTLQGGADFHASDDHVFRLGATLYNEEQQDGPAAFDYLHWNATGGGLGADWDQGDWKYRREDVDLQLDRYSFTYDGSFADGSDLNVAVAYSDRALDIFENDAWNSENFELTYDIDETRNLASLGWSRQFGYRVQLRLGGAYNNQEVEIIDMTGPSGTRFLTENPTETGGWADVAVNAGQKVELTMGARWVDFTYTDNEERPVWQAIPLPEGSKTLPRFALNWKPAPAYTIRLTAGTGYTAPKPIFEQVCCGRRYRSNRGIEMEEAKSAGLEFTYQPSPKLRVAASAFRNEFDNLIIEMATVVLGGQWTYQHANVPEATLDTAALEFKWDASKWVSVRGSVSRLEAENRTEDDAIPTLVDDFNRPVEKIFYTDRVPYLAENSGMIGLDFFPGKATVSVLAQYTGDMLIQASGTDIEFVPVFSNVMEFVPTESFWIYNLRFNYDLPKGLSVYAAVDNINDYVQPDQGFPATDYNWASLSGRYVTGGIGYRFGR
jgi:outer membrane receptor protein involved in Fe transport